MVEVAGTGAGGIATGGSCGTLMTSRAQDLLDEALTLAPAERADMATELLASLGGPSGNDGPETAEAWTAEIERRARRVLSGQSSGEPWEVVRTRVARRLSER